MKYKIDKHKYVKLFLNFNVFRENSGVNNRNAKYKQFITLDFTRQVGAFLKHSADTPP